MTRAQILTLITAALLIGSFTAQAQEKAKEVPKESARAAKENPQTAPAQGMIQAVVSKPDSTTKPNQVEATAVDRKKNVTDEKKSKVIYHDIVLIDTPGGKKPVCLRCSQLRSQAADTSAAK